MGVRVRGVECVCTRLRASGTVHVSVHARASICADRRMLSRSTNDSIVLRGGEGQRVWGLGFRV